MKTKEEIVNNWLPRYIGKILQRSGKSLIADSLKEIKKQGLSVKHLRL